MVKIGILSDTHLSEATKSFAALAKRAFAECAIIIHAGDLTNSSILHVFSGKTVHAVHGNMCSHITRQKLPDKKLIEIDGYTIGLCHGAGNRYSIEDRMWTMFPEADCIIFGHTHQPLCEKRGDILFINPGSFQCAPFYSEPASYAILTIDEAGLSGKLHTISSVI